MQKQSERAIGEEIEGICGRLGITRDELADRAGIKRETMRKIANGYQPASERMMTLIRNVEKMAQMFQERPTAANTSTPERPSTFRWMEPATLAKHFRHLTVQLEKAQPHERKHIIGNLREMLDEMEARELRGPTKPPTSSPPRSGAAELTQRIGDDLDRKKP
jgi:transcriptional regulator with XRE-family HTH domain